MTDREHIIKDPNGAARIIIKEMTMSDVQSKVGVRLQSNRHHTETVQWTIKPVARETVTYFDNGHCSNGWWRYEFDVPPGTVVGHYYIDGRPEPGGEIITLPME